MRVASPLVLQYYTYYIYIDTYVLHINISVHMHYDYVCNIYVQCKQCIVLVCIMYVCR